MSTVFSAKDAEVMLSCPYDDSHRIRRCRIQTHLVKCRRNFPNSKIIKCMFNASHRIPELEIKFHLEECSDRKKIDHFMYVSETVDRNKYPLIDQHVECSESWDDNNPSYDPTIYCENNPVFRHVDTLSAAQRKNFRHQERRRIATLENQSSKAVSGIQEKLNTLSLNQNMEQTQMRRPQPSTSAVKDVQLPEDETAVLTKLINKIRLETQSELCRSSTPFLKEEKSELLSDSSSSGPAIKVQKKQGCETDTKHSEPSSTSEDEKSNNDFPPLGSQKFKSAGAGKKTVLPKQPEKTGWKTCNIGEEEVFMGKTEILAQYSLKSVSDKMIKTYSDYTNGEEKAINKDEFPPLGAEKFKSTGAVRKKGGRGKNRF